MSSQLLLIELRYALQQPGCPICRIYRQSAARYLRFLVLESINDLEARMHFSAGLGYCPTHTRMLASIEVREDGDWMGTNIMYEQLANMVRRLLAAYPIPKQKPGLWHTLRALLTSKRHTQRSQPKPLRAQSTCRVCQLAEKTARYALETLLEELSGTEDMETRYIPSDGLCLNHLRHALEHYSYNYPGAVAFLKEDALRRLERWEEDMQGYILKQTWDHRHEEITPGEQTAWQYVLAFFTGYQPSVFAAANPTQEVDEF